MRKIAFSLLGIIAGFFLAACSKEDADGGNGPGPEPDVEEVVLGDNTVEITEDVLQHLQSTEEGVLTFDASLSADEIPQEGQILLSNTPSEKFPYGFLGRVIAVEQDGGDYRVETESVPLGEVFDKLRISKSIDLVPADAGTRVDFEQDEDGFYCFSQPAEISQGAVTVSGSVLLGVKMHVDGDLDRWRQKHQFDIALQIKIVSEVGLDAEFDADEEVRIKLGSAVHLTPFVSSIVINPVLQLYFVTQCEGSAAFHAGHRCEKIVHCQVHLDGLQHTGTLEVPDDGVNQSMASDMGFSLDGTLFQGLAPAIELQMFGCKDLMIGIETQVGREVSGHVAVDLLADNLYEACKDVWLAQCMKIKTLAKASAQIFGFELAWEQSLAPDLALFEETLYLFPEFINDRVDADETSRTVQVDVGRDLLFESGVGLALYEGDKRVETTESVPYWFADSFDNPLETVFDGLSEKRNYSVWTYVKWGDLFIKAQQLGKPSIVGKWGCYYSKYKYNYNGEIKEEYGELNSDSWYFTFNSDFTGEATEKGVTEKFKYFLDDNFSSNTNLNIINSMSYNGVYEILDLTDSVLYLYYWDADCEYWIGFKRVNQ